MSAGVCADVPVHLSFYPVLLTLNLSFWWNLKENLIPGVSRTSIRATPMADKADPTQDWLVLESEPRVTPHGTLRCWGQYR